MAPPKEIYPFRFFFRKEQNQIVSAPPAFVKVYEQPELDGKSLADAMRDLPPRQWQAILQLLIEAKYKSEALLRDEKVASDHGRLAFLVGFAAYADYVIASFEAFRNVPHDQDFPDP